MEKHLTFESAGPRDATMEIGVGESVAVEVPGRAMSGYTWSAQADAADLSIERQPPSGAGAGVTVGASSPEVFAVQPHASGDYRLELNLKRPWESEPSDTRTLTLRVR